MPNPNQTQPQSAQLTPAQQAAQLNLAARQAIKNTSVKMMQPLYQQTVVPANTPVLTVQPRNVGLLLGFWVMVQHNVNNQSTVSLNLTDFGPMNALANIQFNDFNNTTRVQTTGWHVGLINSVRHRRPTGTALVRTTGFDSPIDFGSNFSLANGGGTISAPASIASLSAANVTMWYWVPLAYSDDDLRGSIYANVVNATSQLILSFPAQTQAFVQNGADTTNAMYVGAAAGSVSAVAITSSQVQVFQYYYDQLPISKSGVLLPVTDLATVYELKNTLQNSVQANQDFGYQYANFRNFLSTVVVWNNNGTSGRVGGTDVNYWSLQAANTTNIWKKTPALLANEFRNFFQTDLPPGTYYFGSRQKPIVTTQYGNMQLILNASIATAGNYQLVGVEDFALIQTLSMAGSLPTS